MRSFVKDAGAASSVTATAEPPPAQETLAKPAPSGAVAHYTSTPYAEGEIGASDVKTPYLSCVAGVGPKSALFSPGTIVLGETVLSKAPEDPKKPTPSLRILFCKPVKTYVENLPYNPSADAPRPRIFKRVDEVHAVGGTTEYRGKAAPSFIPKMTASLLVRQPESMDDDMFCFIAEDKSYAPAMVGWQKSAYSAAKTFWTDYQLSLKNDPSATFYDLFWAKELKGQNWVWVPKLVRVRDEKPTDAIKAIARKIAGAPPAVAEDEGGAE